MLFRFGATLLATSLMLVAAIGAPHSASAQDAQGRVVYLDPSANVIVLEDGRMYRVLPTTVILVDNQPVPVTTIRPGAMVAIRAGELVTLRDGRYLTVAPTPPGTVVTAPPDAVVTAPPTAVVTAPPATVVVPGATSAKRTIYGKVVDVDKDGEVQIKTDKGKFEIQLTPDSVRNIKKGDTVIIDTTFVPPGTPLIR